MPFLRKGNAVCIAVMSIWAKKELCLQVDFCLLEWQSCHWYDFSEDPWLAFLAFQEEGISEEVVANLCQGRVSLCSQWVPVLCSHCYWFIHFVRCLLSSVLSYRKWSTSLWERGCTMSMPLQKVKANPRVKRCFFISDAYTGYIQVPEFGRTWAVETSGSVWAVF